MTGPSRADVGAMANLLKAMNGDKSGLKAQAEAQQSQGGNEIVDVSPGVKTADIKAMENIMRNFQGATANVAKKVATTINESKKTPKGVQVGIYSVEKTDDKAFNIVDSRTNDTLFEDLRAYETAYILVHHLNEGRKINSQEITKVISTNAVFEKFYYDALQHKNTYKLAKKRNDFGKMDIAEARFSRAKAEAWNAKKHVNELYEAIATQKPLI